MKKGLIHHVEIYVPCLSTARNFWHDFLIMLDYRLFQEWESGFSMRLDESYLVFVECVVKYKAAGYHRCTPGLNHLAFWVNNHAEVDMFTDYVKSKGLSVLYANKHPYAGGKGYYALYFEDPMRMKVELVAKN